MGTHYTINYFIKKIKSTPVNEFEKKTLAEIISPRDLYASKAWSMLASYLNFHTVFIVSNERLGKNVKERVLAALYNRKKYGFCFIL